MTKRRGPSRSGCKGSPPRSRDATLENGAHVHERARVRQEHNARPTLEAAGDVDRIEADDSSAPAITWCSGTNVPFFPRNSRGISGRKDPDALNVLALRNPPFLALVGGTSPGVRGCDGENALRADQSGSTSVLRQGGL